MDLYVMMLALGGVGLGAMAVSGFTHSGNAAHGGHGGHGGHAGHVGHGGHAGHGHAGNVGAGHAGPGHASAGHAVQGHTAHGNSQHGVSAGARMSLAGSLMTLVSPRMLFSVSLGLGTAGLVMRPFLGGPLLFVAALAAGLAFERLLVTPIWNLAFKFESNTALTLESSAGDEATAVSAFDANGQGLIAIEVDGRVVQLLGTLRGEDRGFNVKVRAGTKLRVEAVDAERNRCTVALL